MTAKKADKTQVYRAIILDIFGSRYKPGMKEFDFDREDIEKVATKHGVSVKNLGDLLYSFRFRQSLPEEIVSTATNGTEWVIELAGRAKYRFVQKKVSRILPREDVVPIKIPDSTPEIVEMYALSDEQALLAKVRYNRLIDVFLGITTYSLQNHLRTTVKEIGQIEVDELYVGLNKAGAHFVIPVQAKGGKDKIGAVQTQQDVLCCEEKFPDMIVRPVSVQFMDDSVIAMFELTYSKKTGEFGIVDEKHYRLVQTTDIEKDDLQRYRNS